MSIQPDLWHRPTKSYSLGVDFSPPPPPSFSLMPQAHRPNPFQVTVLPPGGMLPGHSPFSPPTLMPQLHTSNPFNIDWAGLGAATLPDSFSFSNKSHKDPSVAAMEKTATSAAKKVAGKMVKKEIVQQLDKIGMDTAVGRTFEELGKGKDFMEAAQHGADALKKHETFVRNAGRVVKAGVSAGVFATAAAEKGVGQATVDTMESLARSQVAKGVAKTAATALRYGNPMGVEFLIMDLLTPTPIAKEPMPKGPLYPK
jgi:hypothetical protein